MTLFEGREVDGITVKLKSLEVATTDTFHHGAEVYVLCRAVIEDIQHPDKDGTLYRRQVAKPDDGWIVPQLTAARMIDAVEPPKLPGTERVRDVSKDATLDVQVGDDGSVTFIDTTTGEKHTAPPDDETAELAANDEERQAIIDALEAGKALGEKMLTDAEASAYVASADIVCTQHGDEPDDNCFSCAVAAMSDGPTVEERFEQAQGALTEPAEAEGSVTENRIEAAAEKPASMIQRVALTKNILAFTEKLTEDFLAWQRKNSIPLNPEHMTFEEARRCLVYVGDITNAEKE